jgi:hypothetical protein
LRYLRLASCISAALPPGEALALRRFHG